MTEAIIIIIFVVAFAGLWRAILYLIKHPNIEFDLEPKVLAHEPELEELIQKILTYLHNEESATISEIGSLLGNNEIAVDVVDLMVFRGNVFAKEVDNEIIISRYQLK